jgi:hypothetical protein
MSIKAFDHVTAVNQSSVIEPHAKALEMCASNMEAAGIGGDITHGHAAVLRRMAACLRADAAHGRLPHVFHDQLHATTSEPASLNVATKSILEQLGV